jgi:hypothetical protein
MQPVFPFKLAAVSWGLTCAGMIAAIITHQTGNNAPLPAAASPPPPLVVAVRTIPMFPELAFDDRWRVPPEPQAATSPADVADQRSVQRQPKHEPEPAPRKERRVERHRHHAVSHSNVCTRHGMHKVITHHGKSWRCRR